MKDLATKEDLRAALKDVELRVALTICLTHIAVFLGVVATTPTLSQ